MDRPAREFLHIFTTLNWTWRANSSICCGSPAFFVGGRDPHNSAGKREAKVERPLSPFMFPTWYRFQITSLLSILHRLTGIALALGSILLAWWLVAVAAGGE